MGGGKANGKACHPKPAPHGTPSRPCATAISTRSAPTRTTAAGCASARRTIRPALPPAPEMETRPETGAAEDAVDVEGMRGFKALRRRILPFRGGGPPKVVEERRRGRLKPRKA